MSQDVAFRHSLQSAHGTSWHHWIWWKYWDTLPAWVRSSSAWSCWCHHNMWSRFTPNTTIKTTTTTTTTTITKTCQPGKRSHDVVRQTAIFHYKWKTSTSNRVQKQPLTWCSESGVKARLAFQGLNPFQKNLYKIPKMPRFIHVYIYIYVSIYSHDFIVLGPLGLPFWDGRKRFAVRSATPCSPGDVLSSGSVTKQSEKYLVVLPKIYKNNDHSTLNVPSLNVSTPSHSIQSQSIPLNFAASAPTAVFPPPTQSVVKVPAHAGLHRVKGNDASYFHQEMNLVISTHSKLLEWCSQLGFHHAEEFQEKWSMLESSWIWVVKAVRPSKTSPCPHGISPSVRSIPPAVPCDLAAPIGSRSWPTPRVYPKPPIAAPKLDTQGQLPK